MTTAATLRSRAHLRDVPAEVDVPRETIPDLLDRAARRFPDHLAIDFLGRKTSYSKLADRVDRAANLLYNLGVRRGDTVALVMPNCSQHVIALFATLRLGAIAAEQNPLAPTHELQEQLDRVDAKVVIAWEKAMDQVCPGGDLRGRRVLSVDITRDLPHLTRRLLHLPLARTRTLRETMRGSVPAGVGSFVHHLKKAGHLPAHIPGPEHEDIAVYLHTGGTTGSPKTVPLSHRNIIAMMAMGEAWVPSMVPGEETIAAILPYFHAFGLILSAIFGTHMGATQLIMPRFDVDMVLSGQRRRPITFLPAVPPIFDRVRRAAEEKGRSLESIRVGLAGAMSLDSEVARAWEEATGGLIIEGYGMTEAAPVLLGSPVSPDRRPGTLGIAFPSTEFRIVNPDQPSEDVEPGKPGELLVRGPQVFSGYLNAPEENAEAFFEGWLRTGDIVVEDDGFVTLADRRKELIISGGFNIYPSQVEEAVRQMPGVVDVAVVGVPSGPVGEKVVAALVLEAGARVDLEAVRAWCDEKLSHYAIPKQVEVLSELPKSQLGKTLRRKVREQILSASEGMKEASDRLRSGMKRSVSPQGASDDSAKEAAPREEGQAGDSA
ncbi:MAG: AMP-binding protein [Bowdeniella nasicola]|nr:AMP-binding protein [Bowdeniella nasicola]